MIRTFWKVPKKCFNVAELQKAVLPKLDYNYEDLEPVLSKEVVEIHHSKHHQAYIDNYNRLIPQLQQAIANGETEKIVSLTKDIKFNGGSHINHSIYWKNLAPIKSNLNKIKILNFNFNRWRRKNSGKRFPFNESTFVSMGKCRKFSK